MGNGTLDIYVKFTVQFPQVTADIQLSEQEANALWNRFLALGPAVLDAIKEHEKQRPHSAQEPHNAQTDYLGLDVMVEERDRILIPVIIEVNDHEAGEYWIPALNNAGGQMQLDELFPDKRGAAVGPWMRTMLKRATEHRQGLQKPSRVYRRVSSPLLVRRSSSKTLLSPISPMSPSKV